MRLNIDLDKLKVFYYVAKAKKFTAAAESLNISQSALSRTIIQLEDLLGIKLFYRHARGLSLTAQGEKMVPIIGKCLNDIETTIEKLYEEEKEPKGPLILVATSGILNSFLLPHIPGFLKLYPEVRLTLKIKDTLPSFEYGEAHVVIRPQVSGPEAEGLIQEVLFTNHTGLYASKEYLDKNGIPKTPEDLDNHQLIAYGDHLESEPYKAMNCHLFLSVEQGSRREPFIQANNPQARFSMARDGLGITAISKEHPGLEESGLVQVLPQTSTPSVESYFVYSNELSNSKKVLALRDYLLDVFSRNFG